MSNTWLEDQAESSEPLGGDYGGEEDFGGMGEELGESYTDGPGDAAEAWYNPATWGSGAARRRAEQKRREYEQRRLAAARRAARATPSVPIPAPGLSPALRQTRAAVAKMNLDYQVADDQTRARLARDSQRIGGSNAAHVLSAIAGQAQDSFKIENDVAQAALRAVPLAPLIGAPHRFLPAGAGIAGVGLVALAAHLTQRGREVAEVSFTNFPADFAVVQGNFVALRAAALTEGGKEVREKSRLIEWAVRSNPQGGVTLSQANGDLIQVKGESTGDATIEARVDGKSAQLQLRVLAPPAS
jgi:hypothetical protein